MSAPHTRPYRMVVESRHAGNRDHFAQPMQGRGRSAPDYGRMVLRQTEPLFPLITWGRVGAFAAMAAILAGAVFA